MNINSLNNTDVTINSGGIVSSRGGQTGVSNAGNINISASRDVILNGATSGANLDRPNDAHIRAYGNESGGSLGLGGVITINAGDDFVSNEFATVNANGTTVPSGSTYTKGVIDINATDTANIDGIYQVGGRASGSGGGGGGLIDISAANDITVDSTSVLEASVSNSSGSATGDGGRIDVTSTNGDIAINGGNTVIGGVTRGLIDFSSGTTGDGGQLNVTATNGAVTFANANLVGTGNNDGGVINVLANANLDIDALSVFATTGGTSASNNLINLNGGSVNNLGTLNANSGSGSGGTIHITNNSAYTLNSSSGTLNTSGATDQGTQHFTGTSIATGSNYSFSNGTLILEASNGNVSISNDISAQNLDFRANAAGGTITIGGNTLTAQSGAGVGGNVTLAANSNTNLNGSTTINAQATGSNLGGNVNITSTNGTYAMASGAAIATNGASGASNNKVNISANTINSSGTYNLRPVNGTTGGDFSMTAGSGGMSVGGSITTGYASGLNNVNGGSTTLIANSGGNISLTGLVSQNGYNGNGGNLDITTNGGGDVTIGTDSATNYLQAYGSYGDGGNTTITANGGGDVNLSNRTYLYNYGLYGGGGDTTLATTGGGDINVGDQNYLYGYSIYDSKAAGDIYFNSSGGVNVGSNSYLYNFGYNFSGASTNGTTSIQAVNDINFGSNASIYTGYLSSATGGKVNLTSTKGNITNTNRIYNLGVGSAVTIKSNNNTVNPALIYSDTVDISTW